MYTNRVFGTAKCVLFIVLFIEVASFQGVINKVTDLQNSVQYIVDKCICAYMYMYMYIYIFHNS